MQKRQNLGKEKYRTEEKEGISSTNFFPHFKYRKEMLEK
jgi:hypothetical protein